MLTATDLWKSYAGKDVVRGISCTLRAGEILSFLGPNGAGKTTTVGMLYGAIEPDRGVIQFMDYAIPKQGRAARTYIGIVTQEDNLDPDFDVVANLLTFSRHYAMPRAQAVKRVDELIERTGLQEHRKHRPDELSGGLKRRLVLARALLNRPKLVFLDEPTTGLDPESRQSFWKLVTDLRQDGCAVALTTHYMDEAHRLADRLLLMQQGKVVEEGTAPELIEKVVGKEMAEIEGVEEAHLRELADASQSWWRPFGNGFLILVPQEGRHEFINKLEAFSSTRLTLRAANLEDVFLRLTGEILQ